MPHFDKTGNYLSAQDAAKVAGISAVRMRKLIKLGRVPSVDCNIVHLIHEDDVEQVRLQHESNMRKELDRLQARLEGDR